MNSVMAIGPSPSGSAKAEVMPGPTGVAEYSKYCRHSVFHGIHPRVRSFPKSSLWLVLQISQSCLDGHRICRKEPGDLPAARLPPEEQTSPAVSTPTKCRPSASPPEPKLYANPELEAPVITRLKTVGVRQRPAMPA